MKFVCKVAAFLLIGAIFLAACGPVETGIKGQVFLAKCTGSEIATDCTGVIQYAATLDIYNQDVVKIKSVRTAGDGTFVIGLKPGTYFIHPENNGDFPMAADFKVVVTQGQLAELTIYYDDGVR